MFHHHAEKKAQEQYQAALVQWQQVHAGYIEMLQTAQANYGVQTDEIMLKSGEHLVAKVAGANLIEDRRGRGTYQGASHGVSFPIASIGGRTIRYRVGQTRGHFVQGDPVPTAIDTGTCFITNQRIIFQGAKQTRECLFSKLIGVQHDDQTGTTVVSVSNREKPTTIYYGPRISGWFDFRVDLALAQFRGTVDQLVAQLQHDLDTVEQSKPIAPTGNDAAGR